MKSSLAIFFVVALVSAALDGDAARKIPVPTGSAQAEATKLVKEVYSDEFSKAKTAAEKRVLAKKVLGNANESKDNPANQFVLLKLARDLATQANDLETAFQAIDEMADGFQVDVLGIKSVVLTKCASTAQKPEQHKVIAVEVLNSVVQAVSQDDFTVADQLGKLGLAEARKARDKELLTQVQGEITEAAQLVKTYENVKLAKITLQKTPDDPEANLVVGKYLCFANGDWSNGVLMLALGSDKVIKAIALQELQGAASSAEQAQLGDAWWAVAGEQKGLAKKRMQDRAGYWYQTAIPGLAGLLKDRAEKRLTSLRSDDAEKHSLRPGHNVSVNPKDNLQIDVIDAAAFDEKMADQFPANKNRARGGFLEASSKFDTWGPKEAFMGSRSGQGCNLGNSKGEFVST